MTDPAPAPAGADLTDLAWLRQALELSKRCPPSDSAFSVGAVLAVPGEGALVQGYSRELDPHDHAEEGVLARAAQSAEVSARLSEATMYTTLEPCCRRLSRPRSCSELILAAGVRRVVLAWLEPPLFVPGGGAQWLADRGVTVVEVPALAAEARAVNAHLLPG